MKSFVFHIPFLILVVSCGASHEPFSHSRANSQAEPLPMDLVWDSWEDPELLPPGPGAGDWASEPQTIGLVLLRRSAQAYLETSDAVDRYGIEAVETFDHYFRNHGHDYELNMVKMLHEVPRFAAHWAQIKQRIVSEVLSQESGAREFSSAEAPLWHISGEESTNWYLAVAGFSYWVKGRSYNDGQDLVIDLELHVWDRYDWDPGVEIPIETPLGTVMVDQEKVGAFHRQGLAREFDSRGVLRQTIRI